MLGRMNSDDVREIFLPFREVLGTSRALPPAG